MTGLLLYSLAAAAARPYTGVLAAAAVAAAPSMFFHGSQISSRIAWRRHPICNGQHLRQMSVSTASSPISLPHYTSQSQDRNRACPDLRILFCGSDAFSAASLRALQRAREQGRLPIRSIDVVCRPAKRAGRVGGAREVREVPLEGTARELGLAVHHVDSFSGWELPEVAAAATTTEGKERELSSQSETEAGKERELLSQPETEAGMIDSASASASTSPRINLIVAVSFGLLIPGRLIRAAAHGGINVHPSLLPDWRGAAPIQRSLLAGCRHTGVSLQTLHPTRFDRGRVLARAPVHLESDSVAESVQRLGQVGADLLLDGLARGSFLESGTTAPPILAYSDGSPVLERPAPKIGPGDRHVRWHEWSAQHIRLRHEVLGPLWSYYHPTTQGNGEEDKGKSDANSRIVWSAGFEDQIDDLPENGDDAALRPGQLFYRQKRLQVVTCDRKILRARECTPASKPPRVAREASQFLFPKSGKKILDLT